MTLIQADSNSRLILLDIRSGVAFEQITVGGDRNEKHLQINIAPLFDKKMAVHIVGLKKSC